MKRFIKSVMVVLFASGVVLPLERVLCAEEEKKLPEIEVESRQEASVSAPQKPDKDKKVEKGKERTPYDIKLILSDPLPLLTKEG